MDRPGEVIRAPRRSAPFALLLAAAFFACGAQALGTSSPPPFEARLGVELPLAGDDGADGLAAWQGVQLALERWNAVHAHVRVSAVVRDTSRGGHENPHQDEGLDNVDDPEHAAAIVREFAADPRILAVVGGLRANVASAEAPVAAESGLPLVALGASNAPSTRGAPFVFRIAPSDFAEGAVAGALARERGYRSVQVLDRDDERSREVAAGFASAFGPAPGPPVPAGAVLYAAPLGRGTFLVPRDAAPAVLSVDQLRSMERRGYAPPATGERYDRIGAATQFDPPRAALAREAYHARWGVAPSDEALEGYLAAETALAALDRAAAEGGGPSRATVLAALRTGTLPTDAGEIGFTASGAPSRSCFSLVAVQAGRETARSRICRAESPP